MSDAVWLPGLIVLAAGLAVGVIIALKIKRDRSGASSAAGDPDLALEIADLERRRDGLYDRLRGYRGEISDTERETLEAAAAKTLQQLDALREEQPRQARTGAADSPAPAQAAGSDEPSATAPEVQAARSRNPLLAGFLFGVGMAAVIALLVYWAVKDTAGKSPDMPPAAAMQPTAEQPHPGAANLPPEVAERIAALTAQLQAQPDDMAAAKELAIIHLSAGQLFEAFQVAETVLATNPDDPDALFVHGVVQIAMGRPQEALDLLDRVLALYPDHVQAMLYRGLAQQELGQLDQAIDSWEFALAQAGGNHPDLEELIRRAQVARDTPAMSPAAPPSTESQAETAEAVAPSAAPLPEGRPGNYVALVEVAPGNSVTPGASLFVFLRTAETGPPIAVKRISNPQFPLRVEMTGEDTMTGGELPAQGVLFVRLDADGSASTSSPGDLQTSAPVSQGESIRLTLEADSQP